MKTAGITEKYLIKSAKQDINSERKYYEKK
jgi:hypothetical protein